MIENQAIFADEILMQLPPLGTKKTCCSYVGPVSAASSRLVTVLYGLSASRAGKRARDLLQV
jgi:hypothetical protein